MYPYLQSIVTYASKIKNTQLVFLPSMNRVVHLENKSKTHTPPNENSALFMNL